MNYQHNWQTIGQLQNEIERLKEQIRTRDQVISQNFHDAVAMFAGLNRKCTVILAEDES